MSRVAVVGAGVTAAALAAILSAGHQVAVLPERRREFEVGVNLNDMLDDAGRRADRANRKAEKAERLRALQRRAFQGE